MLVVALHLAPFTMVATSGIRAPALVVGGGPAGLATAWVLDQSGFDVTLLEQRPEASMYESQKAYLYLVDGRGQVFTDAAGLTDELASPELSVSSTNYTVTRLMPDGERINAVPPILEPNKPAYWIPRQQLCALLARNLPDSVRTLYGTELKEMVRTADGGVEVAFAPAGDPSTSSWERQRPTLVVGADGLGSAVRAKCAEWSTADDSLDATADDFTMRQLPSPSSGLGYKMIRLPPDFRLAADDPAATATPRQAYSVRPAKGAPLGPTRLGLLPVADPTYPRTANVILPPEHAVWKLDGGAAVRRWLADTFPHLPIDEIVSEAEAADFAAAAPGAFPAPCYVPRQQLLLPSAAVCLVGDAIHAFPPDVRTEDSNPRTLHTPSLKDRTFASHVRRSDRESTRPLATWSFSPTPSRVARRQEVMPMAAARVARRWRACDVRCLSMAPRVLPRLRPSRALLRSDSLTSTLSRVRRAHSRGRCGLPTFSCAPLSSPSCCRASSRPRRSCSSSAHISSTPKCGDWPNRLRAACRRSGCARSSRRLGRGCAARCWSLDAIKVNAVSDGPQPTSVLSVCKV